MNETATILLLLIVGAAIVGSDRMKNLLSVIKTPLGPSSAMDPTPGTVTGIPKVLTPDYLTPPDEQNPA
jgi:hypothetical protein